MASRDRGWRALAPALGLAASIAAATGPARAQAPGEAELLYEKWLDLDLNPARGDQADDAGSRTRVVHGYEAQAGAWPSVVNLALEKDGIGRSTCAGTLIGRRWVLTAAHCVFKRREGGVSLIRAATVYAKSRLRFDLDSTLPYEGEVLRVRRVVVHPEFAKSPGLLNDIALLELEKDTTAGRQALAAGAGVATFVASGQIATIVGWGITTPVPAGVRPAGNPLRFPLSRLLREASLPIAPPRACAAFLGRPVEAAEFCAGDGAGGADSCRGDSGGPLFVGRHAGEPIQAGIVSWGPGCAQASAYGVYASVGHFEPWIRKYVPDCRFAAPQDQVTVDVVVVGCTRTKAPFEGAPSSAGATSPGEAPSRLKLGSCVRVQVTSGVTGHLGIFSRNANRQVAQIFPNHLTGRNQEGATPARVRAGQVVAVPGPADGFDLKVVAPLGRAEIVAVVVPDAVEPEFAAIMRDLDAVSPAPRAVGTRHYHVVE